MNIKQLVATGLTPHQAKAYALLIELGEIRPPVLATKLKLTRTNAYKLLDKLAELKLAEKIEEDKKFTYRLANPMALSTLIAEFRSEATAREEAVQNIMHDLLTQYHTYSDKPAITVVTGRKAVAEAYRQQIGLREDIRFIYTTADVAQMGFDTMHDIRTAPARHGNRREALMFIGGHEQLKLNQAAHERSNLKTTIAPTEAYTAPVEWSVTDSSLLIVLYATEPHAIFLQDSVVAGAFLQLWRLLQSLIGSKG